MPKAISQHEPFAFKSSAELLEKAGAIGVELPFQDSVAPLFENITIGLKKIPNRMAVQPMESCDAEPSGSPSELTFRRYKRYAEGGSGLIWFEATSVDTEGRSNPRQLMLNSGNLDTFKSLVKKTRDCASQMYGSSHEVFLVLQLTHSGRYSNPGGKHKPQIIYLNPFLDKKPDELHILSDEELDHLQDKYMEASQLAYQAGFDAVDIKACHGYLLNELLAAFTRKESRYGASFENRSRFLRETIQKVRSDVPGISLAVRLNAYDGIPYPFGFGVSKDSSLSVDLGEPKVLVRQLVQLGCSLINITVGNPNLKPHLGRPFDRPLPGTSLPEEHPLQGVCRLLRITGEFQEEFPEIPFVGTGYSWLRYFYPHVGAAIVKSGKASCIGLGRSSFAYPDAPKDLMTSGAMIAKKVCITCSRCTELMRAGHISGCVVRDKEIYSPEYKKLPSTPGFDSIQ